MLSQQSELDRDKLTYSLATFEPLQPTTAEHIYASDKIAQKIVNILPISAFSEKRFKASVSNKEDEYNEKFNKLISKKFKSIDLFENIKVALKWARVYGAGYLVLGLSGRVRRGISNTY